MSICLRRREFIAGLGGTAAAWPLVVRAQQPAKVPVIGYLSLGSPETDANSLSIFRKGLSETGYVEGQNVAIEYRWANSMSREAQYARLPELAVDLVRHRVAVIVAIGTGAPLAVKALTTTIPVVFSAAVDPVESGLVASLNRPGGNVTGFYTRSPEIESKLVGILHDLLPGAKQFALLSDSQRPIGPRIADLQAAAAAIGCQIEAISALSNREIDAAFATLLEKKVEALIVRQGLLLQSRRAQILTLAARHAVPVIYPGREFAVAGGLMSYGPTLGEIRRQVGIYTGRILKGEKPSDLPVMQPTTFEFVINLQTARVLGIKVPPTLLALADEIIE
jgi:putative ABC transport system substrate-binding protein